MNIRSTPLLPKKRLPRKQGVAWASASMAVGLIVVLVAHGSTAPLGSEAEHGSLSGNAKIVANTSASAGNAVKFSAATTACTLLPFTKAAASVGHTTTKKVWAYYFPPFPLSTDNVNPASDSWSKWLYSLSSANGAYDMRDRPLTPARGTRSDWKQADFEVEVRQALDVGIDGFIFEYHTSSDVRWNQLPAMLAAAKAVDPKFKIMLSPDFTVGTTVADSDKIYNDVKAIAADPNAASLYRDAGGNLVLAPFYPERNTPAWWDALDARFASSGLQTTLVPVFLSWGGGTEKSEWNNSVSGYSQWGTRYVSGIATLDKDSLASHSRGKTWMQPVAFEDSRVYDGRYWEASNSSTLRNSITSAISNNADSIAFMTWNDYTESWLAPSRERGHILDVAAYYIEMFKTGTAPTITDDALYWVHRSQLTTAAAATAPIGRNGQPITMAVPNGDAAVNQVELVAFLTAPGRLTITQGSDVRTLDAAAGPVSFKAPLVAGTTPQFSLSRGGVVTQSITSNTPVLTSVPYQDMIYHSAGGTANPCARP